jgi:hypothetical protein
VCRRTVDGSDPTVDDRLDPADRFPIPLDVVERVFDLIDLKIELVTETSET